MLTLLGLLGAAMALCGYWLAQEDLSWLWLATLGVAINWLGDSLDGTLARHLNIERPKYGFFVDHMTDAFAMALIGIGIGLSPFAQFSIALIALLAYYLMTILSLITCVATQVFRISFNGIGPTEVRLAIVAFTVAAIFFPIPQMPWAGSGLSLYDLIILGLAGLMLMRATVQAILTGRDLALADPKTGTKQ